MDKLLYVISRLRYVAILAVIAPFFGAVLMLLLGTSDTVNAYLLFFGIEEPEGAVEAGEAAMISLVASIDHFLFAAILMIFAVGLYALFFKTTSHTGSDDSQARKLSWNYLKNMGGMDEMLLKVIIMLLAVSFLEFMLSAGIDTMTWTVLVVPFTIIALALGLRWMSAASEEEQKEEKSAEKGALNSDNLDALERLAQLHDQGAVTDAEFADAKTKLLAD